MAARAVFVGRWSPFHKGHLEIMMDKIKAGVPLLILVRNTPYDIYPPLLRKRMIEAAMRELKVDVKVVIIDDIESINYGRGVGYRVNEIPVAENVKQISATEIRNLIERGDPSWRKMMPAGADKVLADYLSDFGIVVWFTGLPKSGKAKIAKLVAQGLEEHGKRAELLNSTVMRQTVSKDLGFSKKDRDQNIERAMYIAQLLARNGAVVLASFITPYNRQRQMIRAAIEKHGTYIEVYVRASIEKCIERDTEGVYKKAQEGKIEHFTGVSDPFEEPKSPEIAVDTDKMGFKDCAARVLDYLKDVI